MMWVFWCCFLALLLSYVLYPAALGVLAVLSSLGRKLESGRGGRNTHDSVLLVVAAYNEADVIAEKCANCLELNYPSSQLRIVVVSDGSDDGTEDIVSTFSEQGIELHREEGRKGKTHCQNAVVALAQERIVVFSDANTLYHPDAISHLVRPFSDDTVGAVIGNRRYTGTAATGVEEGLYERFENWLKARESQLGGTIGACGAIYAVRRAVYQTLPTARISDIVEPLRVACAGSRVVYAPLAIGEERIDTDFWAGLHRKHRIVLRSWNSLWAERRMLLGCPLVAFKLLCHKVLRWLTLTLVTVMAVTGVMSQTTIGVVCGGVACFYLILSGGLLAYAAHCRSMGRKLSLSRLPNLLLYAAGVFWSASTATVAFLRGQNAVVWNPHRSQ